MSPPSGDNDKARPVVRFRDLRKTYRMGDQAVHALGGVSLDIDPGSYWAIMGASGSGKSTMLNLLGCLDRPTSGSYELDGQDIATRTDDELSDIRLAHIGFIFQNFNLIAQLTVRENIELPLHYAGMDPGTSHQRARELGDQVGLADRLDHRPTELSGGQQQRVAVARALANRPSILLADEPTGNLDSATGAQIMDLLDALNAGGTTIIMVTHEDHIAAHAQHRLVMRDGVIDSIDSAATPNGARS